MTKAELIESIAKKGDFKKKDAEKALSAFTDSVTEALKNGDKVQIVGFGTFEVRERKARDLINPRTKEKIHQDAKKAPAFKAGKNLKSAVEEN